MEAFLECARRAYGDLRSPDYAEVSALMRRDVYRPLFDRLGAVEPSIGDITDTNYDVCFTFSTPEVDFLISAVGPYLALIGIGGRVLSYYPSPAVDLAIDSGLRIVSFDELLRLVPFTDIDSDSCPSPLYKMLFTLQERIFVRE